MLIKKVTDLKTYAYLYMVLYSTPTIVMKPTTLHITNGDNTTNLLQKTSIDGAIITWREMLCEGKTTIDVGSESFWKSRFDYLANTYKVTKKHFIDFTVKEFRNLCHYKTQKEIVLWFDADLFCQINMIAVISWLKKHKPETKISLVCPKTKMTNTPKNISDLTQKQLLTHYSNRINLSVDDIQYADYVWQLYCSESPLQLQNIAITPHQTFVYLPKAIQEHLQRFPTIKNGLNKVENTILDTVATKEYSSKKKLISQLLKTQGIYGFGDIQYERKINELKGLFKSFTPTLLNELGYDVLQKHQNYYHSIKSDYSFLGGTLKYRYLYNEIDGKLLKL